MFGSNFKLYVAGSTALTAIAIGRVLQPNTQFYAACLALVTSKMNVMILGNMLFVVALLVARFLSSLAFGTLRDVETEHLQERLVGTLMDTLLIMTIFRDDFHYRFVALFVFLLFVKTFHWLTQDRVDFLQQTPDVRTSTKVKIFALMGILTLVDYSFVWYSAAHTFRTKAPSIWILFGFEYLLQLFAILSTVVKFFLNLVDQRRDGRWEAKGAYVMYLEFVTDMFRLVAYACFFATILAYYGVPLHIIRQLYLTFASFRRRVAEVIRYRKATQNMNVRFPNATPAELRNAETCIVCREEMAEGKKLPCGHILHMHCLRSWLERQQVCPICRTPVLHEDLTVQQQQQIQQREAQAPRPAAPAPPPQAQLPAQPLFPVAHIPQPQPAARAAGAGIGSDEAAGVPLPRPSSSSAADTATSASSSQSSSPHTFLAFPSIEQQRAQIQQFAASLQQLQATLSENPDVSSQQHRAILEHISLSAGSALQAVAYANQAHLFMAEQFAVAGDAFTQLNTSLKLLNQSISAQAASSTSSSSSSVPASSSTSSSVSQARPSPSFPVNVEGGRSGKEEEMEEEGAREEEEEESEEVLLARALELSMKNDSAHSPPSSPSSSFPVSSSTALPVSSLSSSSSYSSTPTSSLNSSLTTSLRDSSKDASDAEEEDKEAIRRRRLLRFSQQ